VSVRKLSGTLSAVADAVAAGVAPAGVGELPADIELQPVTNAVRSVLAVLTPGEPRSRGEAQPAARP
jgi:hypothetical protein